MCHVFGPVAPAEKSGPATALAVVALALLASCHKDLAAGRSFECSGPDDGSCGAGCACVAAPEGRRFAWWCECGPGIGGPHADVPGEGADVQPDAESGPRPEADGIGPATDPGEPGPGMDEGPGDLPVGDPVRSEGADVPDAPDAADAVDAPDAWVSDAPVVVPGWTLVEQGATGDCFDLSAMTHEVVAGLAVRKDGFGNDVVHWFHSFDGTSFELDAVPGAQFAFTVRCVPERCFAIVMESDGGFPYGVLRSSADANDWETKSKVPLFASWLEVVDGSRLFAGGTTDGSLQASGDGGLTWQGSVPTDGGTRFDHGVHASFLDGQRGWIATGNAPEDEEGTGEAVIQANGGLARTTDGGKTWKGLFQDRLELPRRVKFVSANVGFLAGRTPTGPFVRRSDDGGSTWNDLVLPAATDGPLTDMGDLWAFDEAHLLVLGWGELADGQWFGAVFRSMDGGGSFVEEDLGDDAGIGLAALTCASAQRCWACGKGLRVWRYDGPAGGPGR